MQACGSVNAYLKKSDCKKVTSAIRFAANTVDVLQQIHPHRAMRACGPLRKLFGNSKNDLNYVPTRCNSLSNAYCTEQFL